MSFNRRGFVKLLTASFAMPLANEVARASLTQRGPSEGRRSSRPNVILMICDDLGYGDLGCYGSKIPTLHLDAMANAGIRCTHFNAGHPICSASRAALLTGRYGHRSGTTSAFVPYSPTGTSLDEQLLSNLFYAAGYRTHAIGKWHLGDAEEYLPTKRGFDGFYGVPYSDDMQPLPLLRDINVLEPETDRLLLTPRYTEEAVRFLDGQSAEMPFFLYLAYSYPHDPARASARFQGRTAFGDVGDSIVEIDWSVSQVLATLKRRGLEENTLVIFTSDHGPWYQGNPGTLRGRKASTFEGGFRVPMIALWPGVLPEGAQIDAWCSGLDIVPTMVRLCGLTAPKNPPDGVDIWPVWTRAETQRTPKPVLYFSPMGGDGGMNVHCIRLDNWKLRVAQCTGGEVYLSDFSSSARANAWLQRPELYDLELDPAESYDVASRHSEKVAQLLSSLEEEMRTFPPAVVRAFETLKKHPGDISTPPGASPRRYGMKLPDMLYEPRDRRGNGPV